MENEIKNSKMWSLALNKLSFVIKSVIALFSLFNNPVPHNEDCTNWILFGEFVILEVLERGNDGRNIS